MSSRRTLLAAVCCAMAAPAASAQIPVRGYADAFVKKFSPADPEVGYRVTVRDTARGAYDVRMDIRNAGDSAVALQLPDWSPGAYRITNAWWRVRDFIATDSAGTALAVTRPDSMTWLVHNGAAPSFAVRYSVQAGQTPNNRQFLRSEVGLIDGPGMYVYIAGRQNLPSLVRFALPAGWRVGTGLMTTPDSTAFFAPSYDVLIDSPTLVGKFQRWVFTAGRTPHQVLLANDGQSAPFDTVAFVAMVQRIAETAIGIFGQAPYKDYSFIFTMGGGGGLEHLNSTTIGLNPARMAADVRSSAGVIAHEFFHTWNIKRIRPNLLGPFDYTRERRVEDLWFSEGNTSYYAALINERSGVISPDTLRVQLQNLIASHHGNPARLLISPERSSWTTWDTPAVNGGYNISYYDQGELLGLLFDIAIRDSTDNRAGWDDVMRYMFAHWAGERGFASEDLLHAINEVSGHDFEDFWRRYVSGTEEIPWNASLERIGWHVEFRDSTVAVDNRIFFMPPARDLGVAQAGAYLRAVVTPGSAFAEAGLVSGDEVVRVGGVDATPGPGLAAAFQPLRDLKPGGTVTLDVRRDGKPLTVRARGRPYTTIVASLTETSGAPAKAARIRQGILTGKTDR